MSITSDNERLREIREKLKHIPYSQEHTARYYIYYKEDVPFLLDLIKKLEKEG